MADSAEGFRRAILDVLSDDAKARDRAGLARAVFDRNYSLQANMQALEKVIASATDSHARTAHQRLAAAE